jgi:phosphate acyltransferase
MRIVLDAMGTDASPAPDVAGAVLAARELKATILLVGDDTRVRQELAKHNTKGLDIQIVHASQAVTMDDKPAQVGKAKPDSSMHVGLRLVRDGLADAFVTAGNTGAAHAIAMLFSLHRISGIKRPALTAIFPFNGRLLTVLDVGANTDSKPEWLAQFALMGHIYARDVLHLANPRVGLLSNGEEKGKGSQLVQEAAPLLQHMPINFIGNSEPKHVLYGEVDVVVCDGFVGNILVKTFEASTRYLVNVIRDELRHNVFTKAGALLARPAFNRVRRRIDTREIGGAPLLGVNGVVIVAHGSSDATAIKNALRQACQAVQGRLIARIEEGLAMTDGDNQPLQSSEHESH